MEAILNFIDKNGLVPFVGILLGLLSLIVAVTYIAAFVQGRDIAFWPPKIGKRPIKSIKKDRNNEPSVEKTTDRFHVNCCFCGNEISVRNPRLTIQPKEVFATTDGYSKSDGYSHGYQIGCPECKTRQYVQFYY